MPKSKSKLRAEAKDAAKAATRSALEQQYGMEPGALKPKPVPHLGRFHFLSNRKHRQFLNAVAARKPAAK